LLKVLCLFTVLPRDKYAYSSINFFNSAVVYMILMKVGR